MAESEDTRRIQMVELAQLEPDPRNVKEHSMGDLYLSLGRFGVADLPVVDGRTGMLVSGHGRRDALAMLKDAGMAPPDGVVVAEDGSWLVPVITGWASADDDEAAAYLVAANQTTMAGGWDESGLVELLGQLAEADVSLDGVGMDLADLDDLARQLEAPIDVREHQRRRLDDDDDEGFPIVDLEELDEVPMPGQVTCPQCSHTFAHTS